MSVNGTPNVRTTDFRTRYTLLTCHQEYRRQECNEHQQLQNNKIEDM
jgi:hypothetical protein